MGNDLFVCESCGTVDSIKLAYTLQERQYDHQQWLCTCCQGKPWHNQFPMTPYDPENDFVINKETGIGLG
jgi:hypothetical protein